MIDVKVGEDHLLIKNIIKNWSENLDKFKLEKSINWELAIVKNVNDKKLKLKPKIIIKV